MIMLMMPDDDDDDDDDDDYGACVAHWRSRYLSTMGSNPALAAT